MAELTKMDELTDKFAEFICDELCKYPGKVIGEDALIDVCSECKMGNYIIEMCNEYNRINDFENTQSAKLLGRIAELEKNNG